MDYSKNIYRLVDVQDHQGNHRAEQEDCKHKKFYQKRIGCIAQNIRESGYFYTDGKFIRVDVVQDPDGNWVNRNFRTSFVQTIRELENGGLEIVTENSVYSFEPAELKPPVYQDAALLIELYLSNDNYQFCNGFFYDENKVPHQLSDDVHLGMFQDSVLIRKKETPMGEYVCRYFPGGSTITFYDTLYGQQDYSIPMLIHNTGDRPLEIEFERFHATWTILPGESKQIQPFCVDGADPGSTKVPD